MRCARSSVRVIVREKTDQVQASRAFQSILPTARRGEPFPAFPQRITGFPQAPHALRVRSTTPKSGEPFGHAAPGFATDQTFPQRITSFPQPPYRGLPIQRVWIGYLPRKYTCIRGLSSNRGLWAPPIASCSQVVENSVKSVERGAYAGREPDRRSSRETASTRRPHLVVEE